jgi:hypothetical protein
MPAMPAQDLIAMTRNLLDDEAPGDQYTDAELLRYINQSMGFYDMWRWNHMRRMITRDVTITHDGSTELEQIIPYMPRIISVENTSDSPRTEIPPIRDGFRDRFRYLGSNVDSDLGGDQGAYYLQNNSIGRLPLPASGRLSKVLYAMRSPELVYGNNITTVTSSTVVVLPPTATLGTIGTDAGGIVSGVNDYYNETPFMAIDNDVREIQMVTDYVGSTRTLTTTAFIATLTTASDWSIMPVMDPESHMLLVYGAVILGNLRTDEPLADIRAERIRHEREWLASVRMEQDQKNHYVALTSWG